MPMIRWGRRIWPLRAPACACCTDSPRLQQRYEFSQISGRVCDIARPGLWLHIWGSGRSERLHLDTAQRHKASMARRSACARTLANLRLLGRRLQMQHLLLRHNRQQVAITPRSQCAAQATNAASSRGCESPRHSRDGDLYLHCD